MVSSQGYSQISPISRSKVNKAATFDKVAEFTKDIDSHRSKWVSKLNSSTNKEEKMAATIIEIQGLSAHGDQKDLLNWLSDLENKPSKVFLVHGENEAADELRIKVHEQYGFDCLFPLMGQTFEL